MNGELDWTDALTYFGTDIDIHRTALSSASWTTHAILACRFLAEDTVNVESGDGEHAEQKLIKSRLWTVALDQALANWDSRDAPMLILMAVNRSPCGDCAYHLAAALHRLHDKYPLKAERQHFVLASLGYYHSNRDEERPRSTPPKNFTTGRGINELKEAGWRLCTLVFDGKATRRGTQLSRYLKQLGHFG